MNSEVLIMYVNCRTRPIEEMLKDQVEKKKNMPLPVKVGCLLSLSFFHYHNQMGRPKDRKSRVCQDAEGRYAGANNVSSHSARPIITSEFPALQK